MIYIVLKTVINCSLQITVMASANVPPQGLPGSTVIKYKWGNRAYFEKTLSSHLVFEMQMVRIDNPNDI
jgi:hypothetical protein